ncbi:N-acetylmuramate alpha-1-phosphate uridylyltransferase MurU [Paludibacterium yongneupense]|uniref:N-acetylmuramate alpha-1-phosphate uridylyltransferase MurU n=1 Tax=Paludibacterium yongneupense TaxID=400061 RepID=UPI0003F4DB80|nr:nucleotidyltransferase family protein [Paludibacterium yongneupense]
MKAMILAAGRGERMRPLTDHTPKPLLQVGAEPLIGWHVRRLAAAGVTELVINHAWLGDALERRLGDGRDWGVHIAWSPEAVALETAGGIANALPLLGAEPFLVVNGDIFTDIDFAALARRGSELDGSQKQARLIMVDNPPHHPDGDFSITETGLARRDGANKLTYSGVAIYHPEFFAGLPRPAQPCKLLPLLLDGMARGSIAAEHHRGQWLDVGTPERLDAARALAAGMTE